MYSISIGYVIIALIALIPIGATAGLFAKRKKAWFYTSATLLVTIALLSLFLLAYQASFTLLQIFRFYPFSELMTAVFAFLLIAIDALSYEYSADFISFSLFFGLSITGMLLVVMANSLITLLIGLELMGVPTVFMILAHGRRHIEAAIKLFVLSALAISLLAFAIALVSVYNPTLSISAALEASPLASTGVLLPLAIVLFAAALLTEAAAFPFNLWVPDVYEGAPGHVTAMLAGINKKVAFVALIEVFFSMILYFGYAFQPIFVLLSVATMFFGNLVALVQTNVKRMMAYSSISQAGYILVGISASTAAGLSSSIFYMIAHAVMIIGAFTVIIWLDGKNIRTVNEYSGVWSKNPLAAFSLTVFMLSMIGVPPLIGFIGKFLLFSSAVGANLLYLAFLGIINSVISVYYYARVILSMYAGRRYERKVRMADIVSVVVITMLVVTFAFGIFPGPLMHATSLAGNSVISAWPAPGAP
ncbi:MAG: NADH-quinone oxidoreductase subunit N [Candidatus Marsarchaeota archaeon]|nr:NADH-quinone oxidoreductase subunit N [Candidatus Marsarchaeota archaeon]MCL5112425.1 NADH-quinone oxidoreductase subunit N [Candidatus Marsarchaeota archaeon]